MLSRKKAIRIQNVCTEKCFKKQLRTFDEEDTSKKPAERFCLLIDNVLLVFVGVLVGDFLLEFFVGVFVGVFVRKCSAAENCSAAWLQVCSQSVFGPNIRS